MSLKKIISEFFSKEKDEVLKFLETIHNNYLERVKEWGYNTIEEFEIASENYFIYRCSDKYPVHCDC